MYPIWSLGSIEIVNFFAIIIKKIVTIYKISIICFFNYGRIVYVVYINWVPIKSIILISKELRIFKGGGGNLQSCKKIVIVYYSLDNTMWFTYMYGTEGSHNILKGVIPFWWSRALKI